MNDRSKEHVDNEGIDGTFVVNIEDSPKILDRFRSLLVVHSQDELKESLDVIGNKIDKGLADRSAMDILEHATTLGSHLTQGKAVGRKRVVPKPSKVEGNPNLDVFFSPRNLAKTTPRPFDLSSLDDYYYDYDYYDYGASESSNDTKSNSTSANTTTTTTTERPVTTTTQINVEKIESSNMIDITICKSVFTPCI